MGKLERFKQKNNYVYRWIISLLCFLFVIFLAFLGGGLGWNTSQHDKLHSRNKLSIDGNLHYNSITGEFHIGVASNRLLEGVLNSKTEMDWHSVPCAGYNGHGSCIEWENQARLTIETDSDDVSTCHSITWLPLGEHFEPRDCFAIGDAHWFGGAEVSNQRWPIELGNQYESFPYISGGYDSGWVGGYITGIAERYWLSSNGIAIKADDTIPLFVNWNVDNDDNFCLETRYSRPYQKPANVSVPPPLKYTVCQAGDLRTAHKAAASRFFAKPRGLPDTRMLSDPVWTTWARYHKHINQSNVLDLAKELSNEGYTPSQLEIDEKYSSAFGTFDFDPVNFPNASEMIESIKAMGMRVTAWISPFANLDSPIFQEGLNKNYWVLDASRQAPALVKWWEGIGAVLDVTNPEARKWFTSRLKAFSHKYNIDSFKFDAGSSKMLSSGYTLHSALNSTAYFTTMYVDMCAEFGPMTEVRVGFKNQDQPIFFRLQDMDSTWGYDNGLKSLIPRVLYFGLVGYPFILPDIIGGNAYDEEFPEKELFIRWMQVSAFLPSWQFSITPAQYDNQTVDIAKNMMDIRKRILKSIIKKSADEAVATGDPIIRPIWWLYSGDTTAQIIDSEFLIGDKVLVAPVLDKGANSRDIYLPVGRWRDNYDKKLYNGTRWIRGYSAPLDRVPFFIKEEQSQ